MRSKYSVRIYELLKSLEYKRQCEFEIDELKKSLSAEKYVVFKDFRVKVIDIAMREINAYSDMSVEHEFIKQGRKFQKIKFTIKAKPSPDIETMRKIEERLNPKQIKGQITMIEAETYE
jgi:plasmid replication initiation protein